MRATLAACLLAAGCAAAPIATTPRVSGPPAAALRLVPAPNGLDVAGSGGREIGFGRAQAGALAAAEKASGGTAAPIRCGGGREAFALEGLILVFETQRFVGWRRGEAEAGRGCPLG